MVVEGAKQYLKKKQLSPLFSKGMGERERGEVGGWEGEEGWGRMNTVPEHLHSSNPVRVLGFPLPLYLLNTFSFVGS